MKFAKNQEKQRQTLQSATRLKIGPGATGTFKKTPKSKDKLIKKDPFFKDVTSQSNEKGLNQMQGLVRNPNELNLVTKNAQAKMKRRLSMPSDKNEIGTPLKIAKKQLRNSEGRIKARKSFSSADNWEETPVEHNEIELVLPTKAFEMEENEKVANEEDSSSNTTEDSNDESASSSTENSEENESLSSEGEGPKLMFPEQNVENEDSPPSNNQIKNTILNQVNDEDSSTETPEETAPMSDDDESPNRAGVPMFSGISNLNSSDNPAAEEKRKKNKQRQSKLINQLYQGEPSILDKLSHFENKVEELSTCGKLGKSKRRLLRKYQNCMGVVEKIKAGDLSFLTEKTLNKTADGVSNETVKQKAETTLKKTVDVDVTDESVKQKVGEASKKTRFVLFVGNLPYMINQDRISEHFKRVGKVVSVRIPKNKETNESRGFAFVELTNKESYEKALSLHHTFIEGRRINVLYTNNKEQAKTPTKKGMKAKNLKLAAMRKQGLLVGSVKQSQKRSARRAKKNKASVET